MAWDVEQGDVEPADTPHHFSPTSLSCRAMDLGTSDAGAVMIGEEARSVWSPEKGCRLRWPNPLPRPARANKQIGKQWTLQGLSPPVKIWECIPVADRATHVVHCTSQAAALMAPPDEQTRPWGIRPQRVERCASEDRTERKWWVVPPPQSLVDEKETPGPRGRRRMGDGRDAKPNYAACTARIVDRSV
jgi:hypothetical protein